jgi:hypothetical protein
MLPRFFLKKIDLIYIGPISRYTILTIELVVAVTMGPCLVHPKIQKLFKIFRHIESYDTIIH